MDRDQDGFAGLLCIGKSGIKRRRCLGKSRRHRKEHLRREKRPEPSVETA
jgi:hypothetical protein